MSDTYTEPCRTCGNANVRSVRVAVDGTLADAGNRETFARRCGNPKCPTNARDKSLADEV